MFIDIEEARRLSCCLTLARPESASLEGCAMINEEVTTVPNSATLLSMVDPPSPAQGCRWQVQPSECSKRCWPPPLESDEVSAWMTVCGRRWAITTSRIAH